MHFETCGYLINWSFYVQTVEQSMPACRLLLIVMNKKIGGKNFSTVLAKNKFSYK